MYAGIEKRYIINSEIGNWPFNICFHQGRTDQDKEHRDWFNKCGWGFLHYHYHHGLAAHLHPNGKCPYGSNDISIINPYTGKKINLGLPYIVEGTEYYSLNLVSKALTAHDGIGVELGLGLFPSFESPGGNFDACSTGDSELKSGRLGEEFHFTYPNKDNTTFETSNGEIKLFYHKKQAAYDDTPCYAYISLEAVREYMIKDGYFTDLHNDVVGVWNFKIRKPSVKIIKPENGDLLHVGNELKVEATIKNVMNATLIIGEPNNRYSDVQDNLINESTVKFGSFKLTETQVGNLPIRIEVHTGGTTMQADIDAHSIYSDIKVQVEKPKENEDEISFDDAIKKIALITYAFEGSSYTKLTGNFDGQGISFGLLQWNIGQGSLQPLLISMNTSYPEIMVRVFDDKYEEITTMLSNDISIQLAWAKNINDSNNKVLSEWSDKFIALGNALEFQNIQLDAQDEYVIQARKIFNDFGLLSERGLALAFDIAVQNWSVKAGTGIIETAKTEIEKLTIIATSVANQSASQWQEDVRTRKMTIVNGIGTVHGKEYDLSSDYDIRDRIITQ